MKKSFLFASGVLLALAFAACSTPPPTDPEGSDDPPPTRPDTVLVTGVSFPDDTVKFAVPKEATKLFSVRIEPGNATNKRVRWSSTDEAVATISSVGIVTAFSEGTTKIAVETVDGEFTDTCVVIVTSQFYDGTRKCGRRGRAKGAR